MLPPSLCLPSHSPAATTSAGGGLSLWRVLGPAALSRLWTDCTPTRVTERTIASRTAAKAVRPPDRGDGREQRQGHAEVALEAVGEAAVGGQAAEEQQQGPHQQGETRQDVGRTPRVPGAREHERKAEQAEPQDRVRERREE